MDHSLPDPRGPASRTRSKCLFSPYSLTSIVRLACRIVPAPVPALIDITTIFRESVQAETRRLDRNGEDAEGVEVTSETHVPLIDSPTIYTCSKRRKRVGSHARMTTGGRPPKVQKVDLTSHSNVSQSRDPVPPPLIRRRSDTESARSKASSKQRRSRDRRDAATSDHHIYSYQPDPRRGNARPKLDSVAAPINVQTLPHSAPGYTGKRDSAGTDNDRTFTKEELYKEGFKFIPWKGFKPMGIIDSQRRLITVCAGHPDDPDWDGMIDGGFLDMVEIGNEARKTMKPDALDHRRGEFVALATGVSYGGGQRIPGNLVQSKAHQKLLDRLLQHPCMKRIAGFQSCAFAEYEPLSYRSMAHHLRALWTGLPNLFHTFANSIFPAVSFNCGPFTVARYHLDTGNLAGGFCAITSLGRFDSATSAYLILFEFKLMIEFPSGSTILIPSATVHHGNTALQPGEMRCSVTQYCAGGLFRWVDYGFKSAKSLLLEPGGKEEKRLIDERGGGRWKRSLGLISKIDKLESDRKKAFNVLGT